MCNKMRARQGLLAVLVLSVAGTASADWLAADPGTKISLQVNVDGALVVRPLGGAWTHPVCGDVTAAEFRDLYPHYPGGYHGGIREMLIAAAATGSLVNVFAESDQCDAHGHPIVRNIRVQGP
jgi:hypothetical protein